MSSPRNVVVLGATGSIGMSAAKVARRLPDHMRLVGLSANRNTESLLAMAKEFSVSTVCIADAESAAKFQPGGKTSQVILAGPDGLIELATLPEADLILVAIVGTEGLRPTLAAIEAGKDIAIASKEILVMAGGIVMEAARRKGVRILPVDSEHNAIFQCLDGRPQTETQRLLLTCSGGPFRELAAEQFALVTPEMALQHPTWTMGKKISVDSATLFNKGLEMIEAHWLFGIPMERIDVVIHPQSIVHSLVEFVDGSILAQMSCSDMAFPIQFAVTYPNRVEGELRRLDFSNLGSLDFAAPREIDFPSLRLAREAGNKGGTLPSVLNAANEIAVDAFLSAKISFPDIWRVVENVMHSLPFVAEASLEEILQADSHARKEAAILVESGSNSIREAAH